MKKIVRQQNYLKALIESQGNSFITKQTLKCWIRSAVEPLLDEPESGVVLHRIENIDGLQGLLKRLEFSEIKSINYSDNSENLIEKVWANTEFICVLTHRYVSILVWDNNTSDENFVRYYSLYNTKLQYEPLNIIKRNSKIDISEYLEKYNPDRRDNILLNASIRRLLNNLDDAKNDAVLGYAEKSAETLSGTDYTKKKIRIISHEMRNQLSICDLYSEIIKRQVENGDLAAIKNSIQAVSKALKIANNTLLSLKTSETLNLNSVSLKEIVNNAIELCKVYLEGKEIELQIENNLDERILASSESLIAVIINLVKNAVEAFNFIDLDNNVPQNGKYIKIKTDKVEDGIQILVSNNAPGIKDPERIFYEGYTTKSNGSGLGLWICKKSIEEMGGELTLSRSTEDYTEFTIQLGGEE